MSELNHHCFFIAFNPTVVIRRDMKGVALAKSALCTVSHLAAELALEHVANMILHASVSFDTRLDVARPFPTRFAGDDGDELAVAKVQVFNHGPIVEIDGLSGAGYVLFLAGRHG